MIGITTNILTSVKSGVDFLSIGRSVLGNGFGYSTAWFDFLYKRATVRYSDLGTR